MDMNQANILVCDDEVEVADLLKHVLEREGFAVTCCHSGDAALTCLMLRYLTWLYSIL